jgi:hypothetical protein
MIATGDAGKHSESVHDWMIMAAGTSGAPEGSHDARYKGGRIGPRTSIILVAAMQGELFCGTLQ